MICEICGKEYFVMLTIDAQICLDCLCKKYAPDISKVQCPTCDEPSLNNQTKDEVNKKEK